MMDKTYIVLGSIIIFAQNRCDLTHGTDTNDPLPMKTVSELQSGSETRMTHLNGKIGLIGERTFKVICRDPEDNKNQLVEISWKRFILVRRDQ